MTSLINKCHWKYCKISREKFEPELGFEPRTSGFLARCSTTSAILPAHAQISLLRQLPLLPGGAVMTLSAILLTTSELTSPFAWIWYLQCKFPKAQIMSSFSINNLIWKYCTARISVLILVVLQLTSQGLVLVFQDVFSILPSLFCLHSFCHFPIFPILTLLNCPLNFFILVSSLYRRYPMTDVRSKKTLWEICCYV